MPTYAQTPSPIPAYFFSNYAIREQRDSILTMFVTIDASKNTSSDLDEAFFAKLNKNFEEVFPRLPQEGNFATIYEQCRIATTNLSADYSYNGFAKFLDDCYNPFNKIISRINSQYAIKPNVKLNPSSGSAPLSVTFDASDSVDPSNDTIPSSNFFRYYKDTDGKDQVIGQWPVVNHVFDREGNYQVHVTVRSVNQPTEWILDGSETVTVDVTPQSALVRVFANGQQLDTRNYIKIGTAEAQRGVSLDASATVPTGWRTIEQHSRKVSQWSKILYERTNDGRPGTTTVKLDGEGQFTVTLTVIDNQSNSLTETYRIIVSDPLSIIKTTPEQGNTSTTFKFDGTASYSLVSSIKLYTWEIFDEKGEKIDTFQGKSIAKQFPLPGSYTIKLTVEDEQARINSDTYQVYVESTAPEAQFSMEPTQDRKYPSQFLFDAGLSSDRDIINASDELRYQWSFSPESTVVVEEIIDGGKKVVASFNAPWIYQAKLLVQDSYGKVSEIIKDVEIESSLRPKIFLLPKATHWNVPITMIARSNKPLISYDWKFGDGDGESSTTSPKTTHSYDKVGNYRITLTVYGPDNETNTVTDTVFVGEKDNPIPAFIVKDGRSNIMKQSADCPEWPAYKVNRRQRITIDASGSINTKGTNTWLKIYMQPQDGDIHKQSSMSYSFQDLGCRYMDITVRDVVNKKTQTTRAWFSVVNALPTIQNILIDFPQYSAGNAWSMEGISFQPQAKKETDDRTMFEKITQYDPLAVRVTVQWAKDSDGVISYYKWYYYKKDNPARHIETKITPASESEVYFTLPRIGGEYEFGVTMVDNDGGESASYDLIGGGRTVFFPPDGWNTNIPIVTLKQSHTIVKAGDEVTFDVSAKTIANSSDFATHRVIKYDFDGDGTFDLTTKDDRVKHIYREKGTYTPRVAVIFRGNKGENYGEDITVEQNIKPLVYIATNGPYILARDISVWSVIESKVCMAARKCAFNPSLIRDIGKDENQTKKTFVHRYPWSGQYLLDIMIKDDLWQEASRKYPVTIDASMSPPFFYPLTIPEAQVEWEGYSITVGNQLNNTVSYMLQYAGSGSCFMDTNIMVDTNGDTDPANDDDIMCNRLASIEYDDTQASIAARVYFDDAEDREVMYDVAINLIDVKNSLTPEQQVIYTKIGTIVSQLSIERDADSYLRELLVKLQSALDDRNIRNGLILDIEKALKNDTLTIADAHRNQIVALMWPMKDGALIAALWWTPYEQAKAEIQWLLAEYTKKQTQPYFDAIEKSENPKPDFIKEQMSGVIGVLTKAEAQGELDMADIGVAQVHVCKILAYYGVASATCEEDVKKESRETALKQWKEKAKEWGSVMSGILKRVLIIGWIIAVVFGGLVGFFIIKAKRAQAGQAE